ncbi:hypothetical protein BD770DRAFT_366431, partial [Pilaira anomala]
MVYYKILLTGCKPSVNRRKIEVKDSKPIYYYYLSNDCIFNLCAATNNSQINHFNLSVQNQNFTLPAIEYDSRNIDSLIRLVKKKK